MPVSSINKYTCPAHPDEVEYGYDTPAGWFWLNNDVYCPAAGHLLADFLSENPDASMSDAIASLND